VAPAFLLLFDGGYFTRFTALFCSFHTLFLPPNTSSPPSSFLVRTRSRTLAFNPRSFSGVLGDSAMGLAWACTRATHSGGGGATLLPADGRSARQLAAGEVAALRESSTCPTDWIQRGVSVGHIVHSEHEWRAHDRACEPQLRLERERGRGSGGGAEKQLARLVLARA
jgi:hypothetical protein